MHWQQQQRLSPSRSGRPSPFQVPPNRLPYFHMYRPSLSLSFSQPPATHTNRHTDDGTAREPYSLLIMSIEHCKLWLHVCEHNMTVQSLSEKVCLKKKKKYGSDKKKGSHNWETNWGDHTHTDRHACTLSGRFTGTMCQLYDNHLTVWPIMFYHCMNIHDGGTVTTVCARMHAHTHTHRPTQMTGISDWQVVAVQMTEPAVHFKGHFKQTFRAWL